ncbi:hypothetical protein [Streptomyces sp. NPDC046909]|uniref:hypothetical protein n=1 Tax=Streptomyces sp. NPDC046909 TaxID=3155617 RepID=UPI0033C2A68F
MRRFLNPERLWTAADGPDEDRIKPHVLWLPHDQLQVLAYFARLREVLAPYQDFITPVAEPDLHMTIQKIDPRDGDGRRLDAERLLHAAPVLQKALSRVAPISIEIGPPRASASAHRCVAGGRTAPALRGRPGRTRRRRTDPAQGRQLVATFATQTDRNRAELGRAHLDAIFVHNPEHTTLPPDALHVVLREAFAVLEAEAAAGHIGAYGIATWHGFIEHLFTVEILDRLATEAAGSAAHHLRVIQLPVSLVLDIALAQALDHDGPIAEAAAHGWSVHASAPLHGGELPGLATPELAALLRSGLSTAQACLLAAASCPGVSKVLLSASTAAHWDAARAALAEPPIPADALRKVLDVLAPHQPC